MAAKPPRDDRPEDDNELEPVLLSVPDTSEVLSIGTTKTWELIRSGELKSIRIDRRVLVPRSEIGAYVRRKLTKGSK